MILAENIVKRKFLASECIWGRHPSYNTAFTKLARMDVVGTLRECPERYATLEIGLKYGVIN
jgi:hypothetical protein